MNQLGLRVRNYAPRGRGTACPRALPRSEFREVKIVIVFEALLS